MFVYGWKVKEIGSKKLAESCRGCGLADVSLIGTQKVLSFYGIPTLPLRKSSYIGCSRCGSAFSPDVYPAVSGTLFKTPLTQYAGLMVIAVVGILAYLSRSGLI